MINKIKKHFQNNNNNIVQFGGYHLQTVLKTYNLQLTTIKKTTTYNLKLTTLILFTFNFLLSTPSSAQKKPKKERPVYIQVPSVQIVYDDVNYIPEIKSVQFYAGNAIKNFPLLPLGSTEILTFKFDDLRGGSRNLSYSVVHCDAQWKPSNISSIDYLEGFSDDRLNNYRFSFNTYQKYTHYEITLPNFNIIPKLSGNYLIKVYEDGDPTRLLVTRRFYIYNPKITLQAEITQSKIVANRNTHQKINFSIFHPNLNIQNPYQEITAVVMQNGRSDLAQTTQKPLFIRTNQLVYTDDRSNDFEGGNEFRRFDTRSFRYKSEGVYENIKDTIFTVNLFADVNKNNLTYSYQFDEDGNFYILNQDGSTPDYDADYGNINFTLKSDAPDANGYAYVVGKFNAYQKNQQNRMIYDPAKRIFTLSMPLKQGVTDYHYTWADEKGNIIDDYAFDGTFYQTENNYQILIYYRAPGSRFDELIGFTELNSATNTRNY